MSNNEEIAPSDSVSSSSINDESSGFTFNSATDHPIDPTLVLAHDDGSIWKNSCPGVVFLPGNAKELSIRTEDYPENAYSFSFKYTDAAEVKPCLSIDIQGKINTRLLSSNTIYGVFLLYELGGRGFEAKAMIKLGDETEANAERRATKVQLAYGVSEVALGSFSVGVREEREVVARVVETSFFKTGLVVRGIEFRPLVNNVKRLD